MQRGKDTDVDVWLLTGFFDEKGSKGLDKEAYEESVRSVRSVGAANHTWTVRTVKRDPELQRKAKIEHARREGLCVLLRQGKPEHQAGIIAFGLRPRVSPGKIEINVPGGGGRKEDWVEAPVRFACMAGRWEPPLISRTSLLEHANGAAWVNRQRSGHQLRDGDVAALDSLCRSSLGRSLVELCVGDLMAGSGFGDAQATGIILRAAAALAGGDVAATRREQVAWARVGQGDFRTEVRKSAPACAVTGVTDPELLQACHIKPWHRATDAERLDHHNGLMLAPHAHRLFDLGLLSFGEDGSLILSARLPREVVEAFGLGAGRRALPVAAERQAYLAFHRTHVFRG